MTFPEAIKSLPASEQPTSSRLRLLFTYGLAAGLTLLLLWIRLAPMGYKVGDPPALIFFLIPVVISAYLGGAGPGLLATILGAVCTDYFLLPPTHSFRMARSLSLMQWSALIGEGVLISLLMEAIHRSRRRAQLSRIEQTVTLSSIGDGVITTDRQGRVIFMNPEAERLTGWKDLEAVGQDLATVFRIINETTGEAVESPAQKTLRLGSVTGLANHTLLLSRDGRAIPISDSASPIRSPEGTLRGMVLVFRDATEERTTESALRDQVALRENLANIASTAPGVIYSFRLKPDGSTCFPYASAKITELCGLTPEQLAEDAAPVFAIMHPEDVDRVRVAIEESARTLSAWHDEFRVQNPRRGDVWVEARSVPQRESDGGTLWQGFIADVTERKQAEDRVRENERRRKQTEEALYSSQSQLTAALEAGGMGTWRADLLTNKIWLDETSRKLWGIERGAAEEFDLEELWAGIHPDDASRVTTTREALFRHGMETVAECRIVHPDGKVVWIALRGRLERDESGTPLRQTGVIMDITERKRLEEARIRSQKLESLGTLAGGIAHDFNNILLAINGNATMAIDDLPPDHEAQHNLREIRKAGRRATELVRQILAFSRPGPAEKNVTALEPVVREALKLVRATLPATIRVETHLAAELPPVEVADNQIYQVIVNLATNASHAIGTRPGLIEVRLEACEVKGDLAAATPGLKEGPYVVLSVRDDGCGMDAATLSCIFDPFFTTKPQGQGTGLGLSLVHGIIKSHGGAISVQSRPGEGAEFRLWFPAPATPAFESMASQKQPDSRQVPLRIMYVDDESALVSLLSRVLDRMGHRVTAFTDPRMALRAFTENPRNFDVVVTDLAMPHISGLDLARQLRAVRGDLPLVLTSGYVRPGDQRLAAEYGISAIILKPDTVEDLGHVLDRIFREAGVGDGKLAPSQTSG